jgi:two-component system OmpR family response regulator
MQRRIAYVEDDTVILANYTEILRDEGFDVLGYSGKAEAIAAFREELPDLALLDVSLHGERDAGFHVCSELRQLSPDLPIIFLTSHDGEIDKISGLRLGADDYITKDASIEYIIVRIEALFRRLEAVRGAATQVASHSEVVLGELRADEQFSCIYWKDINLELSLTHYWLVKELCANPGQVRSHRELMKACKLVVEANTITAHIVAIRRAFAAVDPQFNCIRTERGRGYRWVAA